MADINSIITTIILFFLLIIIFPSSTTPLEFNYPGIGLHKESLLPEGNVTFQGSEIVLTKAQVDNYGRVTFFENFQLWDNSSGSIVLANFTTEFSFTISANQHPTGDGIAFFLAKPPYAGPKVTDGSGMGLLSSDERSSTSGGLVAVEFDTIFNPEIDPEGLNTTHVGINVNSMRSTVSTSWSCDPTERHVYNATVRYDSRSKNLSVAFTGYEEGREIPIWKFLSYEIDLSKHLPPMVSFGFSAANGLFTSVHSLRSWSFASSSFEKTNQTGNPANKLKPWSTKLVVGVSSAILVALVGFILLLLLLFKKKAKKDRVEDEDENDDDIVFDSSMDNDFERNSGAKRFTYNELLVATNNFSEEGKLGQGGFGGVYKGFLTSSSSEVAVKRVSSVSEQGVREYAAEVNIISRLRHRNLVQLIGWCHRKKDLLLVYEFMPNRSLDSHLFKPKSGSSLTWPARYNIARGLAAALLYLHEEWEQCVLHRDVKSSNVMLDSSFNAKLGDFGLARLVDHDKGSQTTALAGTLGYMAPECLVSGRASRGSDIFSFGVVALEIASGRKPIEARETECKGLVEWVWDLYGKEKVLEASDPRLGGDFDAAQMERLMVVGLWCAHPDHGSRPGSIKHVIHVLDFQSPLPLLPPEMPVPTYLPRSVLTPKFSGQGYEIGVTQSSSRSSQYTSSSQFTSSSEMSQSTALLLTR